MEEMLLKEMGQRLSARRKQLRLTQEEVAERADMTTQTISTAENGIKALRPENIIKLCGALKISADYLLFGTISSDDQSVLFSKVSQLSPAQYRHLEDIVNSFIAAVIPDDKSEAYPETSHSWADTSGALQPLSPKDHGRHGSSRL